MFLNKNSAYNPVTITKELSNNLINATDSMELLQNRLISKRVERKIEEYKKVVNHLDKAKVEKNEIKDLIDREIENYQDKIKLLQSVI